MTPRLPLLAAGILAAGAGCTLTPGDFPVESGEISSTGGADGLPSAPARDLPQPDGGIAGSPAGAPCETAEECRTGFCMTTENIGGFIAGASVPGGYCSGLFCAVDGSDGACTPEMGGVCFSLFPFLGESFAEQGICLAPCETDDDCRPEDDQVCFDAMELQQAGRLTPDQLALYYGDLRRACLPRTVRDAAMAPPKTRQPSPGSLP